MVWVWVWEEAAENCDSQRGTKDFEKLGRQAARWVLSSASGKTVSQLVVKGVPCMWVPIE